MSFYYGTEQPVNPTISLLPYPTVHELYAVIDIVVHGWIKADKVPSPVKFAQEVHDHLVECGHRSEEDDILYDFDEHFKVKFNIKDVPYYFETWRNWQGALNWKIEEDL